MVTQRRTGRGGRVVVCAVVVLLALCTDPAAAHQTAPSITPVIDGFTDDVDVEASVQASQDATLLALRPAAGVVVEVLDDEGRPWARVTDQEVSVDLRSPAFHAGTNPSGRVPDPLPAADGDPWVVVRRDGRFLWFEHRLHPDALEVDEVVLASDEAQDLASWSVPLRVDGADVALEGRLRHVPRTGTVQPRLLGAREVAPGVTIEVAPGSIPVFFLRNDGDQPVTVLSGDGSPYVVLDDAGAAVNLASPTWAEQRRFDGVAPEEDVPDEVRFQRLSTTSTHSWLDQRAALPGILPSEEVRASGQEQVVLEWSIPLQVGDELRSVEGQSVWVPFPDGPDEAGGGSGGGPAPEALIAVAVGLGLVGLLVRRRRRASGAGVGDDA